jgi:BASS family bile acid:Na+ symporter
MSLAQIVALAIKASLVLTVFVAGLRTRPGAVLYLLRNPTLFARSVLAMNLLMPMIALWMAVVFRLHPSVRLALIALALSPIPPFLPNKLITAGADVSYTISLVVMAALLSLITIPFSITALGSLFDVPFSIAPSLIFGIIGGAMLLPLGVGAAIRRLAPTVADGLVKPANLVGSVLLLFGLIALLGKAWPAMKGLLGDGTLLAILTLAIVGLAGGHLLGGPVESDRSVLAVATASRHPAVAIAIVHATLPNATLVPAAVLLDLIVVACLSGPYLEWAGRRSAARRSRPVLVRDSRHPREGGGSLGIHYGRRQDRRR